MGPPSSALNKELLQAGAGSASRGAGKELPVPRAQEESEFVGKEQLDMAGEPLSTTALEQEQAVLRERLPSHLGLFMVLWELEFLYFLL